MAGAPRGRRAGGGAPRAGGGRAVFRGRGVEGSASRCGRGFEGSAGGRGRRVEGAAGRHCSGVDGSARSCGSGVEGAASRRGRGVEAEVLGEVADLVKSLVDSISLDRVSRRVFQFFPHSQLIPFSKCARSVDLRCATLFLLP